MSKKEIKETTKGKNKDKDISIDWFEDHESYGDEENEKGSNEELEEDDLFEEEDNFGQRLNHFLANQKKDVSLEKMLEVPTLSLEDNFSSQKKEELFEDEKIEYIPKNEEDNQMKYEVPSADTHFSNPEMSSTQRILEEQKALYKHIERVSGGLKFEEESPTKFVRPEDTMKKDYLKKRRF